nr:3-phosphoglycerate kinase [Tanacetum cinerariifolium]
RNKAVVIGKGRQQWSDGSDDRGKKIVPTTSIQDGWMGLDIGPDSIKSSSEYLDPSHIEWTHGCV